MSGWLLFLLCTPCHGQGRKALLELVATVLTGRRCNLTLPIRSRGYKYVHRRNDKAEVGGGTLT